MEIWKPVVGFEGYLEVSSNGHIRSVTDVRTDKNGRKFIVKGKVLSKHQTSRGYIQVSSKIKGNQHHISLHRAVAEAFIPNEEGKPQVNHIDGDKLNNKAENLEWCTREENMMHALESGKYKRSKTKATNLSTGEVTVYESAYKASKHLNIPTGNISKVARGLSKSSKGYKFEYI